MTHRWNDEKEYYSDSWDRCFPCCRTNDPLISKADYRDNCLSTLLCCPLLLPYCLCCEPRYCVSCRYICFHCTRDPEWLAYQNGYKYGDGCSWEIGASYCCCYWGYYSPDDACIRDHRAWLKRKERKRERAREQAKECEEEKRKIALGKQEEMNRERKA
jgi:hypothetical protein